MSVVLLLFVYLYETPVISRKTNGYLSSLRESSSVQIILGRINVARGVVTFRHHLLNGNGVRVSAEQRI